VIASAPAKRKRVDDCEREVKVFAGPTTYETDYRVFRPGGAQPPTEILMYFIDEQRYAYGVGPICRLLEMTPSSYRRPAASVPEPHTRCAKAGREDVHMPAMQRAW
jgi:putative transposase